MLKSFAVIVALVAATIVSALTVEQLHNSKQREASGNPTVWGAFYTTLDCSGTPMSNITHPTQSCEGTYSWACHRNFTCVSTTQYGYSGPCSGTVSQISSSVCDVCVPIGGSSQKYVGCATNNITQFTCDDVACSVNCVAVQVTPGCSNGAFTQVSTCDAVTMQSFATFGCVEPRLAYSIYPGGLCDAEYIYACNW